MSTHSPKRRYKQQVMNGTIAHTPGGLGKSDIKVRRLSNGGGKRYVSKIKSAQAKQNPWIKAVKKARKNLGIEGFVAINKGREGKALYKEAKKIY
jgi:hypothetical protein